MIFIIMKSYWNDCRSMLVNMIWYESVTMQAFLYVDFVWFEFSVWMDIMTFIYEPYVSTSVHICRCNVRVCSHNDSPTQFISPLPYNWIVAFYAVLRIDLQNIVSSFGKQSETEQRSKIAEKDCNTIDIDIIILTER